MPHYVALLGHNPRLSMAELYARIPDLSVDWEDQTHQSLAFESKEDLDQKDLEKWGGTMLLAKEINDSADLNDVPGVLAKCVEESDGKPTFSLRCKGLEKRDIKNLYRNCKQHLRKKGTSSRYVGSDRSSAASIVIHSEKLLNPKFGCELVIIEKGNKKKGEKLWVGRTVAAQHPTAYAQRDMHKPVRDMREGFLPPKLAQMMISYGLWLYREQHPDHHQHPHHFTVFDPFCGMGVIPMESILQGCSVTASDISQKAVNACEKNTDWLRKVQKIAKKDAAFHAQKHDARKTFDGMKADVIVTESYLGKPFKQRPTKTEVNGERRENEKLQEEFLRNVAATLPGRSVVVSWPVWYTKNEPMYLERIWQLIESIGFTAVLPPGINADPVRKTPSMIYRRPDQFVGREIVLLMAHTRRDGEEAEMPASLAKPKPKAKPVHKKPAPKKAKPAPKKHGKKKPASKKSAGAKSVSKKTKKAPAKKVTKKTVKKAAPKKKITKKTVKKSVNKKVAKKKVMKKSPAKKKTAKKTSRKKR